MHAVGKRRKATRPLPPGIVRTTESARRSPEALPMKKISLLFRLSLRAVVPGALLLLLAAPSSVFCEAPADEHVVSPQALQQQIEATSAARQQNIETVKDFLSTPLAERAMKDAKVDPTQVRTAIPTLSDDELANLAARSRDAQDRFAAGGLGSGLLLLIILAVVVIIVVAAVH